MPRHGPRQILASALYAAARRLAPAEPDHSGRARDGGGPAGAGAPEVVAGLTLTGAPEHWAARVRDARAVGRIGPATGAAPGRVPGPGSGAGAGAGAGAGGEPGADPGRVPGADLDGDPARAADLGPAAWTGRASRGRGPARRAGARTENVTTVAGAVPGNEGGAEAAPGQRRHPTAGASPAPVAGGLGRLDAEWSGDVVPAAAGPARHDGGPPVAGPAEAAHGQRRVPPHRDDATPTGGPSGGPAAGAGGSNHWGPPGRGAMAPDDGSSREPGAAGPRPPRLRLGTRPPAPTGPGTEPQPSHASGSGWAAAPGGSTIAGQPPSTGRQPAGAEHQPVSGRGAGGPPVTARRSSPVGPRGSATPTDPAATPTVTDRAATDRLGDPTETGRSGDPAGRHAADPPAPQAHPERRPELSPEPVGALSPWPELPTRPPSQPEPALVIAIATRNLARAARLAAEQAAV